MKNYNLKPGEYTLSLLSEDEFDMYKSLIPKIDDWWWLKPQSVINQKSDDDKPDTGVVGFVNLDGIKNDLGWEPNYRIGVRPVIRYGIDGLLPGDIFSALGNRWVVLDKGLAISLDAICHRRIDASAAYWEKRFRTKGSKYCELKSWLDEWGKAGEADE